ncbi:MAG TPA: type VI secretion system baseplate subunit TssK [Gammaproteobacteria bacterium]
MSIDKPIFWHQGQFLMPQHFQISDRLHQAMLTPLLKYAQPHFWGVARFGMQESSVKHLSIDIDRADCLFPDGTWVEFPGNAIIEPRVVGDNWPDLEAPLTVYLGLRKHNGHQESVTVLPNLDSLERVQTRYVSLADPETVRDAYVEGPEAKVKTLLHVVKVFFSTEPEAAEDHHLVPVARLERAGDGFRLDPEFVPAALDVNASETLRKLVKEIRDELAGRALQLDGYKSQGGEQQEFDPVLLRYKLALRTLSRYVPMLFHLTEAGPVHPWQVYGVLRELLGEASSFTRTVNLLGETGNGERMILPYDQANAGECFFSLRRLLSQVLDEITVGPQYLVQMTFDGTFFNADIPLEHLEAGNNFYLIITSRQAPADYLGSLLSAGKFGAGDSMQDLVERALPGVSMVQLPFAPPGLPRNAGAQYIKLDTRDDEWQAVERYKSAGLFWEGAPDDVKVELAVIRR